MDGSPADVMPRHGQLLQPQLMRRTPTAVTIGSRCPPE